MLDRAKIPLRSAAETRARIISTAQTVFSEKGYSHAGLREIAQTAGVTPSLVVKYFKSKANLFEKALISAIIPASQFQGERSKFGEAIAASIIDPEATMSASAMIALSLGDVESREIAARVVIEHIIKPMATWLDSPLSDAQAANIFMFTTGFSIFTRNMALDQDPGSRASTAALFAHTLQSIVDQG